MNTGPTPLPADLESLLIVFPSWVGDAVMATPVLRALRRRLAEARIVGLMRPGLDEILGGGPWLDETIPLKMKGALGSMRAAAAIRRHKPQAVLLLPNSFRSALAAFLGGSPIRIGYLRDGRGALLTNRLAVQRSAAPTPAIDYYVRLGEFALGGEPIDKVMELFITEAENAAADELLGDIDGPFVLLNPGASRPAKRWPAARFARVADALADSQGIRIVVNGSPAEREVLDAVLDAAKKPIVNLSERGVRLGSLKAVMKRAALLITNDTGPRHIAAALGTPLVSLFGPTDHRWTTLNCAHERILLAEPFLPEELVADRCAKLCTIDRITVEDVLAAAETLLCE